MRKQIEHFSLTPEQADPRGEQTTKEGACHGVQGSQLEEIVELM
jgi:hypothetical protein